MMKVKSIPPRERILEAVITCIEKYGLPNLTTRKIAEEAGTNIASINYYFRSKDILVAEALSMALKHMVEDMDAYLVDLEKPFLETLKAIFYYLIAGTFQFPGVSMAHLQDAILDKRTDSPAMQEILKILERLAEKAQLEYPQKTKSQILLALSISFSTVLFTMLSPGFYQAVNRVDFSHPEAAQELSAVMVKIFVLNLEC